MISSGLSEIRENFIHKRVRFITLGCKVNQYETQGMREALERLGTAEAGFSSRGCDYVVINTCTVTDQADKESRYWIRRARREHPAAKIVVTGCYVERNRRDLESMPEIDLIVSNREKHDIAGLLASGCGAPALQDRPRNHVYRSLPIARIQGNRGRAYLKIQDGCDHACSFCKVVLVRGRSRSRPLAAIVEEAVRLRDAGYREVVFSGIQLGAYRQDLEERVDLVSVLEACAKIEGLDRLRLSSIEPTDVTDSLIKALKEIPRCCHHLHIPLQSGDDSVLKRMNRRYNASFYRELIGRLKCAMKDFCLTLDVMAGFPGETDEQFQNTMAILHEVRPLKCHVFPYSRREGTRAARFDDCPDSVVNARVRKLIDLGESLGRGVRMEYAGQIFPVLVEKRSGRSGLVQGLTPNYLKVCFQAGGDVLGQIFPVRLLSLQGDLFLGSQED